MKKINTVIWQRWLAIAAVSTCLLAMVGLLYTKFENTKPSHAATSVSIYGDSQSAVAESVGIFVNGKLHCIDVVLSVAGGSVITVVGYEKPNCTGAKAPGTSITFTVPTSGVTGCQADLFDTGTDSGNKTIAGCDNGW